MQHAGSASWARSVAMALAVFALHWWWYGDLFYQAEFRDWLLWPIGGGEVADAAWNWVTRGDPFTRSIGLLTARLSGTWCSDDWRLVNAVLLTLVPIAALLLQRLVLALGGGERVGLAVAALWAVQPATFDCIGWQAAIHSRFALVFVLLALHAFVGFARRERLSSGGVVLGNLCITVPLVLAFNSKESAWCLLPCLASLVVTGVGGGGGWRSRTALLMLPCAWSVYYFALWLRAGGGDDAHLFSGVVLHNLARHCDTVVEPLGGGRWLVPLIVVAAAVAAWRLPLQRPRLVLAAVGFASGIVLTLPLRWNAPYYMLQPGLFFDAMVCALLSQWARRRWQRCVLLVALLATVITAAVPDFRAARRESRYSAGAHAARELLPGLLPPAPAVPKRIEFVIPPAMGLWVAGGGAGIAWHLFGRADWQAFRDVEVTAVPSGERPPPTDERQWRIVFDAQGQLEGVWIGARRVR